MQGGMMEAQERKLRTCTVEVTETELAILDRLREHADLVQFVPAKVRGGTWIVALIVDGFYTPPKMAREQARWANVETGIGPVASTGPLGPVRPDRGLVVGVRRVDTGAVIDPRLAAALRAADGEVTP